MVGRGGRLQRARGQRLVCSTSLLSPRMGAPSFSGCISEGSTAESLVALLVPWDCKEAGGDGFRDLSARAILFPACSVES